MSNPFDQPDPGIEQQERDLERIADIGKREETVHAHVERVMHRLLDEIEREATARVATADWAHRVKFLAEAANSLSASSFVWSKPDQGGL
jgi:hypothetical protein